MQQFHAGFETEFAAAAMSAAGAALQIVLPNRTPLPATREGGLVQIAKALNDGAKLRDPSIEQARQICI